MDIPDITDLKVLIGKMSDAQLRELAGELYNEYFDMRKTLDEQMLVNEKMYNNYYIYEARVYEALAKFLYVKSEIMMRK